MPKKFNKTTLASELNISRNTLNKRLKEIAFDDKVTRNNYYDLISLLQPKKNQSELYAVEHQFDEEYLDESETSAADNLKRMYKHYIKQYNSNKMNLVIIEQKIEIASSDAANQDEKRNLPILIKQYQDMQKVQMQLGDRIDKLTDKVNEPKKVAPAFDFGIEGK